MGLKARTFSHHSCLACRVWLVHDLFCKPKVSARLGATSHSFILDIGRRWEPALNGARRQVCCGQSS
jgi:hypothetical protein